MIASKRNRPRRDIIEELEAKGQTFEAIMLGWGIVEMSIDSAILMTYALSGLDSRSEPLLELPFFQKSQLLKNLGHLSNEEFGIIDKFRVERNKLVHKGGLFFPNMTEEEKTRLVDIACKAADIGHELSNREYKRDYLKVKEPPWT